MYDRLRRQVRCLALLDGGSQSNFMTTGLAYRLGLRENVTDAQVSGINKSVSKICKMVDAEVASMNETFNCKERFLLLEKITNDLPQVTFDATLIKVPQNIKLANANFKVSLPIDLLLGANIFYNILCIGQIKLGKHLPILQETKLDWIVSGNLRAKCSDNLACNLAISNNDLYEQIENFWKIEDYGMNENKMITRTPEESDCKAHFKKKYSRNSTGCFVVRLPVKQNVGDLGHSVEAATRRFLTLEKRLLSNQDLKAKYDAFMLEYEKLGDMSKINPVSSLSNETNFYLPHYGVIKEDGMTTKLRVVFDASAKTSSGLSLNDVLMIGPTLQRELTDIIIKFRKHTFILVGDIEKMYRQVLVTDRDRALQRILWRTDSSGPMSHYELNTVTYGFGFIFSYTCFATNCI